MAWFNMKPNKIVKDISPSVRIITAEMQKNVFNRSYMLFAFVLLLSMSVIGYTVSQLHETQQDLIELKAEYELNTLVRIKQDAKENE